MKKIKAWFEAGKQGIKSSMQSVRSLKNDKIFRLYEANEQESVIKELKKMSYSRYENCLDLIHGLTLLQVACMQGNLEMV